MSQRTEPAPSGERPEFSNEYLYSLVGLTAFVLLLIYVIMPMVGNPLKMAGRMPWMFPWILAAGQTIANGLTEFSGKVPELVEKPFLTASLIAMFFVGVVAPTFALLLMKPMPRGSLPTGSRALYLVGLIISSTFAFTVVPTGFIARSVNTNMRSSQAIQTNKDRMINELNMISTRIQEYRILPKRLGGGEGTAEGFVLPSDLATTDEATYEVAVAGTEAKIKALSRSVEGAGIEVTVNADGQFRDWTYSGTFQ